jgi:hypothetical protein
MTALIIEEGAGRALNGLIWEEVVRKMAERWV